MHTDEAVGAAKFGQLLDDGLYEYDPFEYHGPTLNYLTLIPSWAFLKESYQTLDIQTLRSVPLFFGMLLVLIPILFFFRANYRLALVISFLIAISPSMVFYSRYYIHELILVFFTFLGIFSYFRWKESNHLGWSILLGISLGMMVATKETWVLSVFSFVLAAILVEGKSFYQLLVPKHVLIIFGSSLVVIILFFSSFFTHFQGLVDMFSTYLTYFDRAGTQDLHRHPWYYYIELLGYNKGSNYLWTELPMLLLAGIGGVLLFRGENKESDLSMLRVIGLFSLILMVIYSIIPYKTPWNLLNFYVGFIFLAGYGVVKIISLIQSGVFKVSFGFLLMVISGHLVGQSFNEFKHPANPSNPYVYGHTDGSFHQVIQAIDSVAIDHSSYIEVIFPGHVYWPFPWYLRKYNQVAFRDKVDFNSPGGEIIIIAPTAEEALVEKLYERPPPGERHLYLSLFDSVQVLRPNVYFNGYLRQDVWQKKQNQGGDQ